MLIYIPKCIELNSEYGSRWVLGLGLGPGSEPRPKTQRNPSKITNYRIDREEPKLQMENYRIDKLLSFTL